MTILERVVEKLKLVNGQAPYTTDFGQRVFLLDPEDPVTEIATPFVLVGVQGIDPGATDGAAILTVGIEVTLGPDFWDADPNNPINPQRAIIDAQADVRRCLGVEHRDLDGALYRGPNSRFSRVQLLSLQPGNSRLAAAITWRYVYHSEGMNGP